MPARSLLYGALALPLLLAGCAGGDAAAEAPRAPEAAQAAATGPVVTVYKTPTCGCCTKWEDHLREHGFQVESVAMQDLSQVKRDAHVPAGLASCHTALVEGYAVEGHVPADVIRKLLAERPAVKGIAVPGMPMGSPGMEGVYSQEYEVYTFDETGPKDIYAAR